MHVSRLLTHALSVLRGELGSSAYSAARTGDSWYEPRNG